VIEFTFSDLTADKVDVNEQHILFRDAKMVNEYKIFISREAPSYSMKASEKISKMIKSVSLVHDVVASEETIIGSAYLNLLIQRQSGEITIGFTEDDDSNVLKFLTKNGGEPIYPTDGTFLLPYDYYFRIKLTHHKETVLIEKDFVLSSNFPHTYQTGEPEFQMIEATFKPIKSWN